MTQINTYKDFKIWQKGMEIVEEIYTLSSKFPDHEKYGLSNQIRKSAISIPSNIAEGWGRQSSKSFSYFLKISRASLFEMETQIEIAKRLNYISIEETDNIKELIDHEGKMINSLIKSIGNKEDQFHEDESSYFSNTHDSQFTVHE